MYLLDTNIVSELRRPRPHGAVLAWLDTIDAGDLFLSAMTMGEIQKGIERTRPQDPAKAEALEEWADEIVSTYQVIPIDSATIRLGTKLMHRRSEHEFADMMIAATAIVHGLILATRNIKDFKNLGLQIFNPFEFSKPV